MNRMSERQQGTQRMESNVTRKIAQKTWNQDLEDEQVLARGKEEDGFPGSTCKIEA